MKYKEKVKMTWMKITCTLIVILFFATIAGAENLEITPIDDAFIDSLSPSSNYGTYPYLSSISTSERSVDSYLTFYVPEFTESATVNLYLESGYVTDKARIARVSTDWSEDTITYDSNRPISDGWGSTTIDFAMPVKEDWISFNVSSVVNEPGYYSFMIHPAYANYLKFSSTDSAENHPYMSITPQDPDVDIGYNSKTGESYSFIVDEGEEISFSIMLSDAMNISKYTWYVNKEDQAVDSNDFKFVVPSGNISNPPSCIWEIRVVGTYVNNTEVIREWLTSSLTEDQAPDFIEYFSDRNNYWRTGYIGDPWGRKIPQYDAEDNFIATGVYTGSDSSLSDMLTCKLDITYGTYKFKIRNPGVLDSAYFKVTDKAGYNWNIDWTANEFHDYFSIVSNAYIPISRRWLGQAPGVHWWKSDGEHWREITIIKTPDGWYSVWENGNLLPYAYANFDEALGDATKLTLVANDVLEMDCIEIYENRYIYPETAIKYGTYAKWWKRSNPSTGFYSPVDDEGIIVFGKNLTLQQISETIDNSNLITYDADNRIAILKTNLSITEGSELNINNEKLIVDTSSSSLSINPKTAVKLNITNSIITATDYPMIWNFASSISENIYNPEDARYLSDTGSNERYNPTYDFRGHFIVENSIIDNTCNLFLDAPYEVSIRNVIFSNHSSIDYGDYTLVGGYENINQKKRQSYGEKGLWIVPRIDLTNYIIENITFIDPQDSVNLKVIGGEWIQNATTIKDSDLSNIDIIAMKALKYEYYVTYNDKNERSTLALLNCIYDEGKLVIGGHKRLDGTYDYDEASILTKYYATIKVVDSNSNPISGAIISATSSNPLFPAESQYEYRTYISDAKGPGQGGVTNYDSSSSHSTTYTGGSHTRWYNALGLDFATTDLNGHTSLPTSSKLTNSIVLTDFALTSDNGVLKKESLTYDFNVNVLGYPDLMLSDISPDASWYREDSNIPTYTITAVIPDNTTGPHITGFAPSEDNPSNLSVTKTFRVWADEDLIVMNWYVDGELVASNSMTYDWVPEDGDHSIIFQGSNSVGSVIQVWDLVDETESPVSSGTGLSFTPSATSLTATKSESTTFTVDSGQEFTSVLWYLDGGLVESGTTTYVENWNTAGTHTVRFDGTAAAGTISRTWTVIVSEPQYSTITISPSVSTVAPGESFSLDVYIDPVQSLTGSQFDLHYSQLASVSSVNEGDLFSPDIFATTFEYDSIDNTFGILSQVYSAIVGSGTVSQAGVMATMDMIAGSDSGILELELSNVILSDASSNPAAYTASYATVLVDTAPEFTSISAKSVDEGQSLSFTVGATDADGDDLTYTATSLPSGASFDVATATFSWTPSEGDAGSYEAVFEVTDGYLTDTVSVSIAVSQLNHVPMISLFEPADNSVFEEGSTVNVNVVATDEDGQSLSYVIKIDDSQVSIASSYAWNLDYESAGTHTIEVIVSDDIDEISSSSTVTVTDLQPRWDVNEDGIVNVLDITLIGQNYGQSYTGDLPRWDVNQDGIVNIQDLSIVAGHFGETV
ncbi:putative Ig domain-containing protein [Methanolobus mangrovi]|uniref:Ig domain-containing protein n=1 Tax=Methanolobus mangrovi TaxID=3072977 RepID=A0AA51UK86_9EURY|nr:putative Ig domain-containing protein [Methanolobus mangrovi]WMW23231.1 putative Ig domain-containing protein [Methanolobus mangrovi]